MGLAPLILPREPEPAAGAKTPVISVLLAVIAGSRGLSGLAAARRKTKE
jgi:hypothetical protein